MGKLSPALLYANCIPFPPAPPFHGYLIRVSSIYPFPARALLSQSLARLLLLSLSLLLCTCVNPARAGEEPAAAFSPSRPSSNTRADLAARDSWPPNQPVSCSLRA